MRNPVRFLALRLRNGNGRHSSVEASPTAPREARGPAASGTEADAQPNETVWYVNEVYQDIWDNEKDAVYDDLPAR